MVRLISLKIKPLTLFFQRTYCSYSVPCRIVYDAVAASFGLSEKKAKSSMLLEAA